MKEPLLYLDEIERYENGLMTGQELKNFEQDLAHNTILKKELELYRQLVTGLKLFHKNRLKQSLRDFDKKLSAPPLSGKLISLNRPFVWLAAACTSLTLAAGLYIFKASQPASHSTGNIAHYIIDDPGLPVLMSSQYESEQAKAMNYYHTGQYQKALDAWNQIPAGILGKDTTHYYKGLFLMKLGEHDSAHTYLSALIETNSAFADRAAYYTAINLWQQQKLDEAKILFQNMKSDTTHNYHNLAAQILEEEIFK